MSGGQHGVKTAQGYGNGVETMKANNNSSKQFKQWGAALHGQGQQRSSKNGSELSPRAPWLTSIFLSLMATVALLLGANARASQAPITDCGVTNFSGTNVVIIPPNSPIFTSGQFPLPITGNDGLCLNTGGLGPNTSINRNNAVGIHLFEMIEYGLGFHPSEFLASVDDGGVYSPPNNAAHIVEDIPICVKTNIDDNNDGNPDDCNFGVLNGRTVPVCPKSTFCDWSMNFGSGAGQVVLNFSSLNDTALSISATGGPFDGPARVAPTFSVSSSPNTVVKGVPLELVYSITNPNINVNHPVVGASFQHDVSFYAQGTTASGNASFSNCGSNPTVQVTDATSNGGTTNALLSFANIDVASQATCTIRQSIIVPESFADSQVRQTTSPLTATVFGESHPAALTEVFINVLDVSKPTLTIDNSPIQAEAGDTQNIQLTFSNTDTNFALSAGSFDFDVAAFFAGASIDTSGSGVTFSGCTSAGSGATSNLVTASFVQIRDIELAADTACQINIPVLVPQLALGNYNLQTSVPGGTVEGHALVGNTAATGIFELIEIDLTAPTVTEVTPVVTPGNDTTPDVTFSTNEAGTLAVGGSCGSGNEGPVSVGNHTISLTQPDNSTPLVASSYTDCTLTIADASGNVSTSLVLTGFAIDLSLITFDFESNTVEFPSSSEQTISGITASIANNSAGVSLTFGNNLGGTSGNIVFVTPETTTPTFVGFLSSIVDVASIHVADSNISVPGVGGANKIINLIPNVATGNPTVQQPGASYAAGGVVQLNWTGVDFFNVSAADGSAITPLFDNIVVRPGSVGTTPATAPVMPDMLAASDTGLSSIDNITNIVTPTFVGAAGSALANSTLNLISSVDGVIGTTTVANDGSWSVTSSALISSGANGTVHAITITVNNGLGTSPASAPLSVTVDATAATFNGADSSPNDNASNVSIADDIVLDFSENIAFGTGNITLKLAGGSDVEVFDIASATNTTTPPPSGIGISADKLYINPSNDLNTETAYAIRLDATAVSDLAGNGFTGIVDDTTFNFITVDVTAPTGYSATIDQSPINTSNETLVSFTFVGAEVNAIYNYTLSSTGGGTNVTGSGTIATESDQITGIDASGLGDGTITLSVTLTDGNNNEGSAATDTETKETIAPTVTEVTPVTSLGNDTTPDVTISTYEAGTLSVGGSCGSSNEGSISAGNQTITLTQADNSTALATGTYNDCTVTITDTAGNSSTPLILTGFTVDLLGPTVVLHSSAASTTSLASIPVTVFFSEPVRGFTESDLTVAGARIEGFVSDGGSNEFSSSYRFTLTPIAEGGGNITVDIASDVTEDAIGNGNSAATQFAIFFDGTPSLVIRNQGLATGPFPVTFNFTEPVTGFDVSDIVLTNATTSNFTRISDSEYRAVINPTIPLQQVIISVPMDAANDADGVGNLAASKKVLGTFPIGIILPLLDD